MRQENLQRLHPYMSLPCATFNFISVTAILQGEVALMQPHIRNFLNKSCSATDVRNIAITIFLSSPQLHNNHNSCTSAINCRSAG
jgi:hypothetical protein